MHNDKLRILKCPLSVNRYCVRHLDCRVYFGEVSKIIVFQITMVYLTVQLGTLISKYSWIVNTVLSVPISFKMVFDRMYVCTSNSESTLFFP